MALIFGYKSGGEACLFDLALGAALPDGWSDDVMIIADPAQRTGEAITAAAGPSVMTPVKVEPPPDEPDAARRAPGRSQK